MPNCNVGFEFGTERPLCELATRLLDTRCDHVDSINSENAVLIFTPLELDLVIRVLAGQLNHFYAGKRDVALVGTLTGSYRIMSELTKHLTGFTYTVNFVKASFYDGYELASKGTVDLAGLKIANLKDEVVILDELLVTGTSLSQTRDALAAAAPGTTVRTAALWAWADVPERTYNADFVAFPRMARLWQVGTGLDDSDYSRGWGFTASRLRFGSDPAPYWAELPSELTAGAAAPESLDEVFLTWRRYLRQWLGEHENEAAINYYE